MLYKLAKLAWYTPSPQMRSANLGTSDTLGTFFFLRGEDRSHAQRYLATSLITTQICQKQPLQILIPTKSSLLEQNSVFICPLFLPILPLALFKIFIYMWIHIYIYIHTEYLIRFYLLKGYLYLSIPSSLSSSWLVLYYPRKAFVLNYI